LVLFNVGTQQQYTGDDLPYKILLRMTVSFFLRRPPKIRQTEQLKDASNVYQLEPNTFEQRGEHTVYNTLS
jgi:hypothetical protein